MVRIVIIFRFSLKDGYEEVTQLGGLNRDRSGKEIFEALRKISDLNVFNNAVIPIDVNRRVEQL